MIAFSLFLATVSAEFPTEPVEFSASEGDNDFSFQIVPLNDSDFPEQEFKTVDFDDIRAELTDAVVKCENRFILVSEKKFVVIVRESFN